MNKVTARDKVIDAAQHLMTARGYSATTVDEIVDRAGVAKGSFYHAFKSKEELAIEALADYVGKGWAIAANGPYTRETDPVKRAVSFARHIEKKAPEMWDHGCLLGSMAMEVADRHPAVHQQIDQLFDRFEDGMAEVFAPALKSVKVSGVTAKGLARHMLAIIEGAIITARSHSEPRLLVDSLRHFRRYLEMLLTQH